MFWHLVRKALPMYKTKTNSTAKAAILVCQYKSSFWNDQLGGFSECKTGLTCHHLTLLLPLCSRSLDTLEFMVKQLFLHTAWPLFYKLWIHSELVIKPYPCCPYAFGTGAPCNIQGRQLFGAPGGPQELKNFKPQPWLKMFKVCIDSRNPPYIPHILCDPCANLSLLMQVKENGEEEIRKKEDEDQTTQKTNVHFGNTFYLFFFVAVFVNIVNIVCLFLFQIDNRMVMNTHWRNPLCNNG